MSSTDSVTSGPAWRPGDVVRDGADNLFNCVEGQNWFGLPTNEPAVRGYRSPRELVDPLTLLVREGRAVSPDETDSDVPDENDSGYPEERKGVLADIQEKVDQIYARTSDPEVEALAWQVERLAALFGGRVLQ